MPETIPQRRPTRRREPEGRTALVKSEFTPPRRITVSQWAERFRVLGDESAEPGRWKNWRVPYLVDIMDAFTLRDVEEIVFAAAAQIGKTEFQLNCLGYLIDQDPGPTLLVYPDEDTAKKVFKERLHPLILRSPALREHLPASRKSDALGLKTIELDRCILHAAWSGSPASLASTPIRYLILDEVDKFPRYSGIEANPIKLAAVRTRTFKGRGRKHLIVSSPTLDIAHLWSVYERSDQNRYWVPCPSCGAYQILDFALVKWPTGAKASDILEQDLAWYECGRCQGKILDAQKAAMVARGKWAPRGCTVNPLGEVEGRPPPRRRRGYQISALYSPFVSFSEVAAEFLESKDDASLLQNFFNSWLGLPWQEKIESVTEARIRRAKRDYPAGAAPDGARALTAGVDVQADVFYFAIRAWGMRERSWLIRYGRAMTWDELWEILQAEYPSPVGPLRVQKAMVDSGYRTSEVYRWCLSHRPVAWPTKGSNNPALIETVRMSRPEAKTILWTFKADFFKDRLATLIGAKPGEPGEWCTHREVEDEYVRQMTAEQRVIIREKGKKYSTWRPKTETTPNHWFDCEVLNVLAADQLHVRYWTDDNRPAVRPSQTPQERRDGKGDGWLTGDRHWFDGGSLWRDG